MDEPRSAVEKPAPPPPRSGVVWPDEEGSSTQPFLASRRVFRVLVGLCLVLAAVAALAGYRSQQRVVDIRGQGVITSVPARDSALPEATELTEQVLSYDWKTLDADVAASKAVLAPVFRGEYAEAMSKVKDKTIENQVTLTADVVATSVISASEQRVEALVFVNQITKAKGNDARRLDQNRLRVTLTRVGGDWRVSNLDSF